MSSIRLIVVCVRASMYVCECLVASELYNRGPLKVHVVNGGCRPDLRSQPEVNLRGVCQIRVKMMIQRNGRQFWLNCPQGFEAALQQALKY